MNLPLVHILNFAVCRQHNILTITMKHNCIQCHAQVQCNVITYDLYIVNLLCFILIRISTVVKLLPSPRLCVVSLFSWSVKLACTLLTKPEEKERLLPVYPTPLHMHYHTQMWRYCIVQSDFSIYLYVRAGARFCHSLLSWPLVSSLCSD